MYRSKNKITINSIIQEKQNNEKIFRKEMFYWIKVKFDSTIII